MSSLNCRKKPGRKSDSAVLSPDKRLISRRHHAIACMLPFFMFSFLVAALIAEIFTRPEVYEDYGPINKRFWLYVVSSVVIGLVFGYLLHRYLYLMTADGPKVKVKPGRIARAGMKLGHPVGILAVILIVGFFLGKETLRANWMCWRIGGYTPGLSASTPEDVVLWRVSKVLGHDAEPLSARLAERLTDNRSLSVRREIFYLLERNGIATDAVLGQMGKVALGDEDEWLRQHALIHIYQYAPEEKIDGMLFKKVITTDKSTNVVCTAAKLVGELCNEEILMQILTDPDMKVPKGLYQGLKAGLERRLESVRPEFLVSLIEKTPHHKCRQLLLEVLENQYSAKSFEVLVKILQSDTGDAIRARVARALGRMGDKRAAPFLVKAMDDSPDTIRIEAAKALGRLEDASAVPALIKAIDDPNSYVRAAVALALGQLGAEEAVGALCALLEDTAHCEHWGQAAKMLYHRGDPSALPSLRKAYQNTETCSRNYYSLHEAIIRLEGIEKQRKAAR